MGVGQGSKEDKHKMILLVVSSLLLASMAFGAPGANYGAVAHVSPAKQISSPSIQCRTEYVTLWDTEYQEREEPPVHHQASPSVQDLLNYGVPAVPTQTVPQIIDARDKQKLQSAAKDDRI